MTIARFYEFGGHAVPFRATIFADFVFNLQGLANAALLVLTHRCVPDATAALPLFAPRKRVSGSSPEAFGITPFVLPPDPVGSEKGGLSVESAVVGEVDEKAGEVGRPLPARTRPDSTSSFGSVDSQTPFVLHLR